MSETEALAKHTSDSQLTTSAATNSVPSSLPEPLAASETAKPGPVPSAVAASGDAASGPGAAPQASASVSVAPPFVPPQIPIGGSRARLYSIKLTPPQEIAARPGTGRRVIVATAGSGKTTTISYAQAYLMQVCGVPDREILATTFTKAGAAELKERVDQMAGRKTDIQTGTIHSFCANLLMVNWQLLGYEAHPTIIKEDDQKAMIEQLMQEVTGRELSKITAFTFRDVMLWLGETETREWTKDPRDQDPWTIGVRAKPAVLDVCNRYRERARRYGYLDFDMILSEALRLLRDHGPALAKQLPRYVFVDEAQDMSAIQWFIVDELAKYSTYLCVIGDDEQSIYMWRRALTWRFRKFFDESDERCFLSENRRCGRDIVRLAADVVEEIPETRRIAKDHGASRAESGTVRITILPSLESVERIALKIQQDVKSGAASYNDYAFIARSKTLVFPALEGALTNKNIPFKLIGGESSLDTGEARLVRAIGNLVLYGLGATTVAAEGGQAAGEPPLHWARLFGELGISPGAVDKLIAKGRQLGHGADGMLWAVRDSSISEGNRKSATALVGAIREMRAKARPTLGDVTQSEPVMDIVKTIVAKRQKKIVEAIMKKNRDMSHDEGERMASERTDERMEALRAVLSSFDSVSLAAAMAAINTQLSDGDAEENGAKVTISTCHGSKGLEWDTVFVMEANDASWPTANMGKGLSAAPRDVHEMVQDEERRLLYVAITRGKNMVYLVSTIEKVQRGSDGKLRVVGDHEPSRFLPAWVRDPMSKLLTDVIAKRQTMGMSITPPPKPGTEDQATANALPQQPGG